MGSAVKVAEERRFKIYRHDLILDVLQMIAGPLVLSSANRTGRPEARGAAAEGIDRVHWLPALGGVDQS